MTSRGPCYGPGEGHGAPAGMTSRLPICRPRFAVLGGHPRPTPPPSPEWLSALTGLAPGGLTHRDLTRVGEGQRWLQELAASPGSHGSKAQTRKARELHPDCLTDADAEAAGQRERVTAGGPRSGEREPGWDSVLSAQCDLPPLPLMASSGTAAGRTCEPLGGPQVWMESRFAALSPALFPGFRGPYGLCGRRQSTLGPPTRHGDSISGGL